MTNHSLSYRSSWKSLAFFLLVLIVGLLSVWLYQLGADFTFFRDEWDMILYRRPDLESLLASHGGQQVPFTSAFFLGGSEVFGLDDYQYFRAATIPLIGLCSIVLFLIVAPGLGPWIAFLASLLLLGLGASYEVALWPMVAITFAGAALTGLSALLLSTKGNVFYDVCAAVLLVLSVSISGFGLVFLVGVGVFLLLDPSSRPCRLWIPAPALTLYLAWYLSFQTVSPEPPSDFVGYIEFPIAMLGSGIHGLTGLPPAFTIGLGLLLLVAILAGLRQGWSLNPLLVTSLVMLAVFLALTTESRGGFNDPGAIRYIFPTVLLLLLILLSLRPETEASRRLLTVALVVLCLISIPHGLSEYSRGAESLREQSRVLKAELAAAEIGGRETISPETPLASTVYSFPTSYHLFDAIDRFSSSPALTIAELQDSMETQKAAADSLLLRAQGVVRREPKDRFLTFLSQPGVSCARFDSPARKKVPLKGNQEVWISSSTSNNRVSFRRFAAIFPIQEFPLGKMVYRIQARADRAPLIPWVTLIYANRGSVRVCQEKGRR